MMTFQHLEAMLTCVRLRCAYTYNYTNPSAPTLSLHPASTTLFSPHIPSPCLPVHTPFPAPLTYVSPNECQKHSVSTAPSAACFAPAVSMTVWRNHVIRHCLIDVRVLFVTHNHHADFQKTHLPSYTTLS